MLLLSRIITHKRSFQIQYREIETLLGILIDNNRGSFSSIFFPQFSITGLWNVPSTNLEYGHIHHNLRINFSTHHKIVDEFSIHHDVLNQFFIHYDFFSFDDSGMKGVCTKHLFCGRERELGNSHLQKQGGKTIDPPIYTECFHLGGAVTVTIIVGPRRWFLEQALTCPLEHGCRLTSRDWRTNSFDVNVTLRLEKASSPL